MSNSWLRKCVICNSHLQLMNENHRIRHENSVKHIQAKLDLIKLKKEIEFKLNHIYID